MVRLTIDVSNDGVAHEELLPGQPVMTDAAVDGHNLKLKLIPKCYFMKLPFQGPYHTVLAVLHHPTRNE